MSLRADARRTYLGKCFKLKGALVKVDCCRGLAEMCVTSSTTGGDQRIAKFIRLLLMEEGQASTKEVIGSRDEEADQDAHLEPGYEHLDSISKERTTITTNSMRY